MIIYFDNKTENRRKLFVFFNFRGSYDLHFNQLGYADPNVDKMKVPWTPLDPTIMIPYHTLNGRIPLTFDPPGKSSASVG